MISVGACTVKKQQKKISRYIVDGDKREPIRVFVFVNGAESSRDNKSRMTTRTYENIFVHTYTEILRVLFSIYVSNIRVLFGENV